MLTFLRDAYTHPYNWLLLLLLQLPALRSFYKYVPEQLHLAIPLVVLALVPVYHFILHPPVWAKKIMATALVPLASVAITVELAYLVYPLADGLKHSGGGSDADDAMIQGALYLWQGASPYIATTYFGNPISPGPGWIVLFSPLVLLNVYWLITPVMLALLLFVLWRQTQDWLVLSRLSLILPSSLMFWELLVVGSDLWALSCLAALLLLIPVHRWRGLKFLAVVLLAGTVGTARSVLFYFAALPALHLWPQRKLGAVAIGLLALSVTVLWHAFFWQVSGGNYPPLHLLTKGGDLFSGIWLGVAILLLAATCGYLLWLRAAQPLHILQAGFVALYVPLLLVALADLMVYRSGSFALWEGANYLIPPIITGVLWLLLEQPKINLKNK